MVEESISAFETFCKHHDMTTLSADQSYITLYEDVVRIYTSYAALKTPVMPKGGLNASIATRWRSAGLKAVKSITASEALATDVGRQIDLVMPVILQNLQSGDPLHLTILQQKAQASETAEKEQAMRRRMSIATVQTAEGSSRPTSANAFGTVDDADRLAEEEVSILALQSLKDIYSASDRGQIRQATAAMLKFVCGRASHVRPESPGSIKTSSGSGTWATSLIEMVTTWTPVQDRFAILVTIMETLVRSPIVEENLEQQLVLVSLVGCLLRSSINMIGLSVMDVLLGLIQHILRLLQLGGKGSNFLPHYQQTDAIDLFRGTESLIESTMPVNDGKVSPPVESTPPSSNRQQLLARLQKCIGDLAVHIYYSDQISDIIKTLLIRLKPSNKSNVATATAAIEHPQEAAQAISSAGQLRNPGTDEFFSFGTARVTALKAIRDVLTVASSKRSVGGAAAIGRNRVGIEVWEGTQWLLRDEDRRVRRAYVDAILTWLRLEISPSDARVWEEQRRLRRNSSRMSASRSGSISDIHARARPYTSPAESSLSAKSTFLKLIHLAIYDNAIASPENEDDLLLSHLLLHNLVDRLGVNAVQVGLPMILRLQEDINDSTALDSPIAKIKVGSLCHGYFWTIMEKFDIDTSTVGYVVQKEIARRKELGLWLQPIQVPPLPIDQISSATARPLSKRLDKEVIRPFDARTDMVDKIAESYSHSTVSPPTSPPASPGRALNIPILTTATLSPPSKEHELPQKIKDAMLREWTKESCIAAIEQELERAASQHGSKRGYRRRDRTDSPTSSSGANEDPEANAAALRGELPRLSAELSGRVPPVPPLPAGVAAAPRPVSAIVGGENPRKSEEAKKPVEEEEEKLVKKGRVDMKAFLSSLDALTAGKYAGGIGEPPY